MEYRIKSQRYIDPWGKEHDPQYFVEYRKPFLFFWQRWVEVTHLNCGWGDCHSVTTYFGTLEEAEEFAKKHLCEGRVHDGHEIKVVGTHDCKSTPLQYE